MTMDATYRPRTVSEIIDAGVHLLRREYRTLISITAIAYVPWVAASTVALRLWGGPEPVPGVDLGSHVVPALIAMAGILWFSVVSAGCIAAASDAYLGREPQVGGSLRRALGRAWPILATSFVTLLAAGFGMLLLLVGTFYFYARYALSWTVALLEGRGVRESLGRAARLSRDNKFRILGTLVAVWFIYIALAIALGAVVGLIGLPGLDRVADAAVTILVSPLIGVTTTVLYYDLRIRHEGFDIELLERRMVSDELATAS